MEFPKSGNYESVGRRADGISYKAETLAPVEFVLGHCKPLADTALSRVTIELLAILLFAGRSLRQALTILF